MARLTDVGAFTGASARLPRKSAALPGVVGPDAGNDPAAKVIGTAPITSAAVINSFRTAILTTISIQRLMCLRFFRIRRARQAQFSGAKHQGAAVRKPPSVAGGVPHTLGRPATQPGP